MTELAIRTRNSIPTDGVAPAAVLGKAEMYDLYKLDRDAKKAFGGMGFFPKEYGDILERYFTIGEIDVVKANEVLENFFRAKEETFLGDDKESK